MPTRQEIVGNNCNQISIGHITVKLGTSLGQHKLWQSVRHLFAGSQVPEPAGTLAAQLALSEEDRQLLRGLIERERKYQGNMAKVVEIAASRLADGPVDEAVPEPEWISLFYEYAKTKATEQMQRIWGAILAQKIRSPQTGKPLTLHCLRMLTYDNALFFENLCKMTVRTRDKVFILKELVEDFEYGELLELENIGLINADKGIGFYPRNLWDRYPQVGRATIEITQFGKDGPFINAVPFTTAGIELYNLIHLPDNDDYLQQNIGIFKKHGVFVGIKGVQPSPAEGYQGGAHMSAPSVDGLA